MMGSLQYAIFVIGSHGVVTLESVFTVMSVNLCFMKLLFTEMKHRFYCMDAIVLNQKWILFSFLWKAFHHVFTHI